MRILHIAALVSQDGAYGGPLRVAMNQTAELIRRGHTVHLAAGWAHQSPTPTHVGETPARLHRAFTAAPGGGFSGLISPGLLRWLRRNANAYDLVHVHAGRDLVSLTSILLLQRLGVPYVVQTHGMVGVDGRLRTRIWDAAAGRRALRGARRMFYLTSREARDLEAVLGSNERLERLVNGVPPQAQTRTELAAIPDVLFCARLQARKRPLVFVQMAKELVGRGHSSATFSIVGPDEGELGAVQDVLADGPAMPIRYEGSLDYAETGQRMLQASVYVLPSMDEPFPMSLLEALSYGVPSVCTTSCGLADELQHREAAMVTDGSPESLANAVETLLTDSATWQRISKNALQAVSDVYGIEAVVDQLESAYAEAVTEQ